MHNSQSQSHLEDRPVFRGEVLVCEDNEINQEVIADHLSKCGLTPCIAANGFIGVTMAKQRLAENQPYSLIFMDIHMPVMDGLEAGGELVKIGNKTPVIALTANVMKQDRETYSRQGITGCLSKPFLACELCACLLRFLSPVRWKQIDGDIPVEVAAPPSRGQAINQTLGLEHVSNDADIYHRLCANFLENNREIAAEIETAVEQGQVELARRLVYATKIMARALGAERLSGLAAMLETRLANNSMVSGREQIADYSAELGLVLRELDTATSHPPASTPTPPC